jgi:ABC-type cobalamin/Fe3+-siderophores transport system ATPase subunit
MLAGTEARGLSGAKITSVRFQGVDQGYAMDDLIVEGSGSAGDALLEIQSKRDISFSPNDPTFKEVVAQIARSGTRSVSEDRHQLAVATQRQSKSITGPYQDVLMWSRAAKSSREFFDRVKARGVGSDPMRTFVSTFRANLIAEGIVDDDDTIWKLLRRFAILVFDFESTDPLARLHGLALARQVLADEDVSRAESLWSGLIEISIAIGKVGGVIAREELRSKLVDRNYRLAGDRDYRSARARLADLAKTTLANIGTTVAGVQLNRLEVVATLNVAIDQHRFVELQGGPGVGKSGVLKLVAERVGHESQLIVLDPISTPTGGWLSFAQAIGVPGTATEFFNDLAASGGGLIVIDGLEMFTDPGRQRTVNDLLREAANVPGFAVVATARFNEHASTNRWIAADVIAAFNGIQTVSVGELTDEEVETLSETTPELRAILAPRHPAANISRNLYRLSRLLKIPASLGIRTEAMLANQWWNSADNSAEESVRAGQRIIARLAEISLAGGTMLGLPEDSAARLHLTRSLTLTEPGRDQFTFYHDVLRDWAIGNFVHEDHARLSGIDLSVPASPRIARGIEFASRLALEASSDCARWLSLVVRLSPVGAHSSWRRHGLLAIVRSEASPELLEGCTKALLARGGALFAELVTVVAAVDTISIAELYASKQIVTDKPVPKSLRTNATGTGYRLLGWVLAHANEIPLQAIGAVVNLVEIQLQLLLALPTLASPTTAMLFNWLRQLDLREAKVTIPADPTTERLDSTVRGRMVEDLRTMALLLSGQSPDDAKAYLREIDAEHDVYKVKAIRQFSAALASAAPAELADLIAHSLIEPRQRRKSSYGHSDGRAFNHIDTDYLPASPAQPPFLELLLASPEHGLALVRRLVAAAIESHSDGADAGANGFTIVFDYGPRFFPWTQSYFWSRDQAHEYSAASGLKALEAWGHLRLDAGEPVEVVLADILGPDGSSAAYLLVAVDVMISHFPATRSALVPFLASPKLIAIERQRKALDQMDRGHVIGQEPSGKVMLADLRAKPSRGATLEDALAQYISKDVASETLRGRLRAAVDELEPYEDRDDFSKPAFMGRYALNVLDPENWVEVEGGRAYRSPSDEAAHLERLGERQARLARKSEMDARIQLAIDGSEHATTATARDAVEYANGDLPDDSDTDPVKSRSSRLIASAMLVARDGEDDLLDAHEDWVREVIRRALTVDKDRYSGSNETLRFNAHALAALALLHLWRRRGRKEDRDALVSIAARRDLAGRPAFAAALPMIADKDPRILKAAMRAAFAGLVWRWHPYDEDETVQRSFDVKRSVSVQAAVAAEIAWLDGSEEPAWPAFPDEKPIIRSSHRIRVPRSSNPPQEGDEAEKASDADTNIHIDSQSAASWLRLLNQPNATHFSWGPEIVEAYSSWSAKINGLGHPPEAETDRSPSEWNAQFYALFAETLMHAPQEQFDLLVEQITALPDEPFGDVAEAVLHAADVLYFNDASRSPERPIELRARMATRTMALWRWRSNYSPGDLSIDHHTGGVVAKILLNTHNPIGGTRSYLVPAVADRLDPLLEPMSPLQVGGPTTFVALCTMNMLLVAPRARHLEFVLAAVEAWFERVPSDAALWITMGIGRKIVDWFEAAIVEEPGLLTPAHPQRIRIDRVLGQLVSVGIAEAYELEKQVESTGTTLSQGRFSQ